eukprot:GHVU01176817.1.p2 GENE.GHVU01176817.1~~GHVU01176817.1.p2  ORF type:complete len:141 (+),score=11.03 GHVU01176817.1:420-842(+)
MHMTETRDRTRTLLGSKGRDRGGEGGRGKRGEGQNGGITGLVGCCERMTDRHSGPREAMCVRSTVFTDEWAAVRVKPKPHESVSSVRSRTRVWWGSSGSARIGKGSQAEPIGVARGDCEPPLVHESGDDAGAAGLTTVQL